MPELSQFQIAKLCEAEKGFCYDANPTTWPDKSKRNQMEQLVRWGFMEKSKNYRGDRYGFYKLTESGMQALKARDKKEGG